MNYFYDLLVNLNERLYEFYEWEKDDEIIHLKKIPIFKISKEDLLSFTNNDIKVNKEFIQSIHQKAESYEKNTDINNIVLFANNIGTLVLEFDKQGNSIYRSKLLLEEELEVLEYLYSLKLTKIDYQIVKPLRHNNEIRQIRHIKRFIETEINSLCQNHNISKLKYLYSEITSNNCENFEKIKKELDDIIKSDFSYSHLKLYNIIKLSYKHLSA